MRENTIDEIKSRCNIVDVIGRAVTLKKAGSNYKGICPFHSEKTPSFVVSEQKQIFTCFGCGATGDVIEFVKRYYNLDFGQAMEKLADECGVVIENDYRKNEHKEELYEINRQAARFFYKTMREKQNEAWEYMTGRGMDKETMQKFGIGYADGNWNSLLDHMRSMGYKEEKLMELGLISHSKGKYYDKFRNRVIFPIQNTSGKVIGFGGRTLEPEGIPKYLNSQESSVFMKKNNLYGLNITRQDIGREDCAVLVEGYMDVISLYRGGVRNVVASLGTALTENQARMLKRYTKNVVLSYDADTAGQTAALRGMDILHHEGCRVRVLHVSDGKDPDEFIKKRGKEAFQKLINDALPFADYKIEMLKQEHDLDSIEERADFLEKTAGVLNKLNPVEADLYINRISEEFNISDAAIRAQMGREKTHEDTGHTVHKQPVPKSRLMPAEKNMLKIILTDSHYIEKNQDVDKVFTSIEGRSIFDTIKKIYVSGEQLDAKKLADELTAEEAAALDDTERNIMLAGNTDAIYDDCIAAAIMDEMKEREQMIIARLSMADEIENKDNIRELTEELIETQRKIKLGGK